MRRELPSGTVTFLFTDIEGSTKLLHELGQERYAMALHEHRQVLRAAFTRHGGVEVDTEGDAFFVAFPDPAEAVSAATEAQEALAAGPIRVRMGLHTGSPHVTTQGYVGVDVHKGARLAASSHGGQVVISKETRTLLGQRFVLLDLGEHRLKDFEEPTWIYQLGTERFPPLKTISNTNLPRPVSSFVGRERETTEIAALLRNGARLLTLTGPGGTGKTRLAIAAATELVPEFRNGVFWVALAALRDPSLVLETIAKTIGAHDSPADHIGQREMLLVIDNLEQVIEAAVDLAGLLEACPRLRLLTTSRELLRVGGEVEYAVEPLPTHDGVALFCNRARSTPDATIAELCRRLDNLPLAIELAAARANTLAPEQMLERLGQRLDLLRAGRGSDARQQTLRSTIEWSYELLEPAERDAFARLAVFRGGFTIEAAEAIDAAGIDAIQSLADRSLVRRREQRLTMLETIRDYATERLAATEAAPGITHRHALHFLTLAEEAEQHVTADDRAWIDRLEDEHDNISAAFDHFQAVSDGESMQRLVGTMDRFWFRRGYATEGRQRAVVALSADDRPTAARASALIAAAFLGAVDDQRAAAGEALDIYRALGDRRGVALAEMTIGEAYADDGEWLTASPIFEHALDVLREIGDEHQALLTARGLAWIYSYTDRDRSLELHLDNLRRARELGNRRMEAITLGALAVRYAEDMRLAEARTMLVESHRLHVVLAEPFQTAADVLRFSFVLLQAERFEAAAELRSCAESLAVDTGFTLQQWDREFVELIDARLRVELAPEALQRFTDDGARMTAEAAVNLALSELALGIVQE